MKETFVFYLEWAKNIFKEFWPVIVIVIASFIFGYWIG